MLLLMLLLVLMWLLLLLPTTVAIKNNSNTQAKYCRIKVAAGNNSITCLNKCR